MLLLSMILPATAYGDPRTPYNVVDGGSSPTTIQLPGAYRLDAYTCRSDSGDKSKEALDAIANGVSRIQGDLLGCLKDVNPRAYDAFVNYIADKKPIIYCGGRDFAAKFLRKTLYGSEEKSGASEDFDSNRTANATGSNGMIVLWTADPFVNDKLRAAAKPLPNAVPRDTGDRKYTREERMAARQSNYDAYAPEPQMMSLLFHETMHLVYEDDHLSFPTGTQTGHVRTDPTDTVYQCTMVCSGPKNDVTQDGCLGCMRATGRVPDGSDVKFCKQFFGGSTP